MAPRRSEQNLRRAARRGVMAGLLAAAGLLGAPATGLAHPSQGPVPEYLAQLADQDPEALRALPEAERRRLEQRIERWQRLSPQDRQRIRERHERLQELPTRERERVRKNFDRWRRLSPEERERMRQRHERFEKLPADQRRKLRERGRPGGHEQGKKPERDKQKKRKKRDH